MDITPVPVPVPADALLPLDPPADAAAAVVKPLPVPTPTAGPRPAPAAEAAERMKALFTAVLTAQPYMERAAAPTGEQQQALRERAAWRTG